MASPTVASLLGFFLRDLAIAWRARATYPPGHPSALAGLARATESLEALLAETGTLELAASRNGLLQGEDRIETPTAARLSELLRRRGAAALVLEPGAGGMEFERFLDALVVDPRKRRTAGSFAAELAAAGLARIRVRDLDFSDIALVEGDGETAASEAGSLWDRLVRRVLEAGGLDGARLAAWLATGRSAADLLRFLLEGEGPADLEPWRPATIANALRAAVADYAELPDAKHAAGIARLYPLLGDEARIQLVRELVAAFRPVAEAERALAPLLTALPEEGAARLKRALAGAAAAEAEAAQSIGIDRDRFANLRRAFATTDVDAVLDERPPERVLEVLLELPGGDARPPLSDAAAAIARELEPAALDRANALAILELAERSEVVPEQLAALLTRLESGYLGLLRSARLRQALDLAERVQRRSVGVAPGAAEFRDCADRLAGTEPISSIGLILSDLSEESLALVRALVERLGPTAVRNLVGLLAEAEDRAQRHRLLTLLASLGSLVVLDATARLGDPRWYVVRNMLLLLRRVGDPGSVSAVRRCAEHPDLRVRIEAIRNLFAFDQELPRELLRKALAHSDPRLAEAAIELAGEHAIAESAEPLADLLVPWDPFGSRRSVRLKAIRALGTIGDPRTLERLERYSRRFAIPPAAREERIALYRSLSGYPIEARRPWVERGLRSGVPQIRSLSRSLADAERRNT